MLAVKHRTLDMYVLMVVAVIGAALIGEWFEAATVVVLFSVAQALERRSMDRARRAISTLLNVDATEITVRRGGDACCTAVSKRIPLDDARVGDIADRRAGRTHRARRTGRCRARATSIRRR